MDEKEKDNKLLAPCDIYKNDDQVIVQMEMPGVNKDGLNIQIDGNLLIIEGKRNLTAAQGEYKIKEIRQGSFYHEFTLDDTIDREKVDAKLELGVLTVSLKVKESEAPKIIKVTSA